MNIANEPARSAGQQSAPKETTAGILPAEQGAVNSLSEKIATARARRLASVPRAYRKLFERSHAGKVSPRTAIKCFCLECIGFERTAIRGCAAYACPLWQLRPYQHKEGKP